MVYIIISIVVLFVAVVIYGALSRKGIYRQIDQLESWKIEIMNRPVTDEMARVKRLKMFGETEEKFETWRQEWDDIITIELPVAEERLFEAEEAADKYRFSKARSILADIRSLLEQAEKRIEILLADLEQLVTSEEQNRQDIVSVKGAYHETKKQLLTHRRFFQKAIIPIEKELKELDEQIHTYDQQTEEGNYLEARSVLLGTKERQDVLQAKMDRIPKLFTALQTKLPEQIKELRDGYQDMVEQGYVLDHLSIEDELKGLEKRLNAQMTEVEKAETRRPQEEIDEMQIRIDFLYDQLEGEVAARQIVAAESPAVKDQLDSTEEEIANLKNETELVQLSYRIEQEDLQIQQQLEREIKQLRDKFAKSEESVEEQKQAFSRLRDQLEVLKEHLNTLENKQLEYKEMLRALRKDELKAKKTLMSLRKRLVEAKRLVQKSNLPGLPYHYLTNLETAEEKIVDAEKRLNEKPLEMAMISQALQEALKEVDESFVQSKKIIEDAALAERLIQYGNRYRSRYQSVSANLAAAESSFRNFHYEEALELAAGAVQKVEPDILRKFDVSIEKEA